MIPASVPSPSSGTQRILQRCAALAGVSDDKVGLTRLFLSQAMGRAHELAATWMRSAGMSTRVDEMGNLIGRLGPAGAPAYILGSHLDSVPGAGHYDGTLGFVLALEAVSQLEANPATWPVALEVIGFSDEEGVRFGTPYLGSRAVAGEFDCSLLALVDEDGVTLEMAMRRFGLVPEEWPLAAREPADLLGYLEVHIEQGPALQASGEALAVVSTIVGQSRWRVAFEGRPGHAGTLPMKLRSDALTAASAWILEVETVGRSTPGLVTTVGSLEVMPNVPNIVPGRVECALDVRHGTDSVREETVAALLRAGAEIAEARGLRFSSTEKTAQNAAPMAPLLKKRLHIAAEEAGLPLTEMCSGAGHDAVIMAGITPSAMLFIRTPSGRSHCPEEDVLPEDVEKALQVTTGFLRRSLQNSPAAVVIG